MGWLRVEDEEVGGDVYPVLVESILHVWEDLGLREDEFCMGDADGMGEFGARVGGVCAYAATAGADDGEDEEGVEERVEAVDADCIIWFEAGVF